MIESVTLGVVGPFHVKAPIFDGSIRLEMYLRKFEVVTFGNRCNEKKAILLILASKGSIAEIRNSAENAR